MKRRLFNLPAMVSAVLGIASIGLWVRSYWRSDILFYGAGPSASYAQVRYIFGSDQGDLSLSETSFERAIQGFTPGFSYRGGEVVSPSETGERIETIRNVGFYRLGFGFLSVSLPLSDRSRALFVPHWFAALLFLIPPALALLALTRRARMVSQGCCTRCGYDLRASKDRCSECGAVIGDTGTKAQRHEGTK